MANGNGGVNPPEFGLNFTQRCCKGVVTRCEGWFAKFVLHPLLFTLPPSAAVWLANHTELYKHLDGLVAPVVIGYLRESSFLIMIGAYLYIIVLKATYAFIVELATPERELSREDLSVILESLNEVVRDKSKRFSDCAKRLNATDLPHQVAHRAFHQITQPTQQIGLLVSALRAAFNFIDKTSASYRVGLLIIVDGKPVNWGFFDPIEPQPRTSAEELQHRGTTVMHCIKQKVPVLVEDIQAELRKPKSNRRYVKFYTREGEHGSLLCVPVMSPVRHGVVEYVITISGNRKDCLQERHLPLYEWIITHYSMRVGLERSLMLIKEGVGSESAD